MIQLAPPRLITFAVSVVLAALLMATLYTRILIVGAFVGSQRLGLLGAAYAVLMLGLVVRGL